jgi:hypothetical protein
MKKKIVSAILTIVVCFFLNSAAHSQTIDSTLQAYSDNFQQEKIHIHFDKTVYSRGDTIWYKAYVFAGAGPSDYSKSFYADWYDDGGKLIKHYVYPIMASSASGRFDIPANYNGGSLHVCAYTKWMLNFDSSFLYDKRIAVIQPKAAKPAIINEVTRLSLFPEGGELINGLETKVAFMATNTSGIPVSIHGVVRNLKGEDIDSFSSRHDGMGSFIITPKAGERYTAAWYDEHGRSYTTALPLSKTSGANMQVQFSTSGLEILIKRTADADEHIKMLNLVAHSNQQVMYRSIIKLNSKTSISAIIPTGNLPSGVLQLTLFDDNWMPLAERAVFINNHDYYFNPVVTTPVTNLTKRGKNIIEVEVPDSAFSNLSIAVTDGELPGDSSNTIISQLLMCGDIKGYVNNPSYYFSSGADSVKQFLDLVMLTHGWRRFNWQDVVKGKMPLLINQRENDFIQFKANVSGTSLSDIKPDQKVVVIIRPKDTTAGKHSQTFLLDVHADGSFSQNGFFFYDTLKVSYNFPGNRKLDNKAKVTFFNGLLPPPGALAKDKLFLPFAGTIDTAGLARTRYFDAEIQRKEKVAMLQEVIVRAKTKTPLQIMDEKYTFGLFSGDHGSGAFRFDVLHDPRAAASPNIFLYLKNAVAGLDIETNPQTGEYAVKWRQSRTDIFLDETRVNADVLSGIPMSNVAYIKVFRPIFFGSSPSLQTSVGLPSGGAGGGGAIAVYLRKGDEGPSIGEKPNLHYNFLGGYSIYKQFYSPDYTIPEPGSSDDTRTTLYWNPYILTSATNHKVKLEFYNNDSSRKLRIVLEGVNADGRMARVEKIIE